MKKYLSVFHYIALIALLVCPSSKAIAQVVRTDTIQKPSVLYSAPKRYEIADITVSGIDNYEDFPRIAREALL